MVGWELPRSRNDKPRYEMSDLRFVLSVHRMEADIVLSTVVSSCSSHLERNAGRLLRPGGVSTVCLRSILSAIALFDQNVGFVIFIIGKNIQVLSMTAIQLGKSLNC